MTTTKTIPMKQGEATASLQPSKEVRKMIAAIAATCLFMIEEKDGTVKAWQILTGKEVFVAIQKGSAGTPWIVRCHKHLFA